MQIVIEIDENIYNAVKDPSVDSGYCANECYDAVWCGIPLPKGHGNLKDFDKIEWYGCTTEFDCPHKDRECKDCNRAECSKTQVDTIPTIIEADKAESEKT